MASALSVPSAVAAVAVVAVAGARPFASTRPRRSPDPYEHLRNALPLVPHAIARRFAKAGRSRNSQAFAVVCVIAAVTFYLYNSQTVPVTGRRRFNFLSDKLVAQAHVRAADAVIRQVQEQGGHFLSDWDPRTMLVKRVMKRLIPVSGMADLDWEILVIADNGTANAFVLPGGKVFVHSGILNICRNEDALAAVLGHEIAHNTASHAAERLSAAWVGNLTAGSVFFLAGALPGLALFGLWSFVGGFYLQDLLFYLPMGRKQESEADYIGLMMMAEACYDPRAAVGFWQRMETMQHAGGQEVPEMLSTHPSNEHRIAKITEWLPEAMRKRTESDCRGTAAFADRFRLALRRRRTVVDAA
ncbi:Mitochondrial metalloendopeptidase OMA1 [Tolypocladium ophioglossoides CBS 100239]|uniref:Mitochondrial metalloendopeptidase OMA1 n=1 Tax=Tolypocladium ophioglossoides (strain CBS 100239) TaxID=1163406 RepID=A0A0L0N6K7_TOLOC|nr:Mitochondrial metalloendopeptidase OMA1 [Tolypocladium ophioglossoides CBS 100239]